MQAIEFVAKAQKGSIKIPQEYLDLLQDQFRVIILQEVPEEKKPRKKRSLSAVKVTTKDITFNRDEANER